MRPWLLATLLATTIACGRQRPAAPPSAPRMAQPPGVDVRVPALRLTPELALATIRARYVGAMRRCYRRQLARDPGARGDVVVTFTVDDRGKLAYRRARGVGRRVERCVEHAMARWSFPQPSTPTTFRLAFRLSSRS